MPRIKALEALYVCVERRIISPLRLKLLLQPRKNTLAVIQLLRWMTKLALRTERAEPRKKERAVFLVLVPQGAQRAFGAEAPQVGGAQRLLL
jgi:hypothetical protein